MSRPPSSSVSSIAVVVLAALCGSCSDDAAGPDEMHVEAGRSGGDGGSGTGGTGGASGSERDAAAPASSDAGAANDGSTDAGTDAGPIASQVTTSPTGLYLTSGGGIGKTDSVVLRVHVGAPAPYGSGQSDNLRLQLGVNGPNLRP
jgi:hypothetical protein